MADFVGAQYTIDEVTKQLTSKTAILTDTTNGLAAIKTAEGTIDGRLTNASTGLSPTKSAIDTANGYLANGTYGLNAIRNTIINTVLPGTKNMQVVRTQAGYYTNAWTPLINVSGKGKFYAGGFWGRFAASGRFQIRLTVDGAVVWNCACLRGDYSGNQNCNILLGNMPLLSHIQGIDNTSLISISVLYPKPFSSSVQEEYTDTLGAVFDYIPFNSSFKLDYYMANLGSGNSGYIYMYSLD